MAIPDTYTLISGETLELAEFEAPVREYLAVVLHAARDPDVGADTVWRLVHSTANPRMKAAPEGLRGVVLDPDLITDTAMRVMLDLITRKHLEAAGDSVDNLVAEYTLTVSDAAERLGIGTSAVRQALQSGRLVGAKRGGTWYVDEGSVATYRVSTRGPRSEARTGDPVQYVRGGVDGLGLKIKADPRARMSQESKGVVRDGTISDWSRIGVLTYVKQNHSARYFELEPADEHNVIEHGVFRVEGRFAVARKLNNSKDARQAWKVHAWQNDPEWSEQRLAAARRALEAHGEPTDP